MIREKKWRVLLLDTKRSNPNHYISIAIENALRTHPAVESVHQAQLGNAIVLARDNLCNLFIAFDGEELHVEICKRIRDICGQAILWVTEDPYELPYNLKNAGIFDLIFTNDSASVMAYGTKGVHLPLAACPEIHYRQILDDKKRIYDLFFAGTAWPNRVELFRRIIGNFTHLKFKLALAANQNIPRINLDIPASTYSWRTSNYEFANFANSSKAVLSLHRDYTTSPDARSTAATPGPRLFEVAMAGGFQLVDSTLPEVGAYFEPGREIVTFDNDQDCVEKLYYYLEHDDERNAMALAAQKRALEQHTYKHRLDVIFNGISGLKPDLRKIPAVERARPKVLLVSHNIMGNLSWGGVEVYQNLVIQGLRANYEFMIYVPDEETRGKNCILYNENMEIIEQFHFESAVDNTMLSCEQREKTFSRLLIQYRIAVVHFQHLLQHVPSLPVISRGLGIPAVLSLHDYYFACYHLNLVGMDKKYCGIETQTISGCNICLKSTIGAGAGSQSVRRSFLRRILAGIDLIHANTQEVVERFATVYGKTFRQSAIEVMGVPVQGTRSGGARRFRNGIMRVAILGNFTYNKGADLILGVIHELQEDNVEFIIYGRIDSEYIEQFKTGSLRNVSIYGPYSQGELDDELATIDISLHVSLWPETYCMTLSEAWLAGIVPVVSDIGALGERVRNGINGYKFEAGNAGALVDILRTLASSPMLIEKARSGISSGDYVTIPEHMKWLDLNYRKLCEKSAATDTGNTQPEDLHLGDCGILLNNINWLRRQTESMNELNNVSSIDDRLIAKLGSVSDMMLKEFPQHAEYINLQKTWNEPVLKYFSRYLPPATGNIISIGSFLGASETALSDEVHEIICCDLDDYLSKDRSGNMIFNKINLDSFPLNMPGGHFNACLCIEVLEHLRWSPVPLLQWIRNHCDLLVISTPDDNEWPPVKNENWTTTSHFSHIPVATAESAGNPVPMEHCKQYSQTEFIELLDKTGFRIVELQRVGTGGHQMLAIAIPRHEAELKSTIDDLKIPGLSTSTVRPNLVYRGVLFLCENGLMSTVIRLKKYLAYKISTLFRV